MGVNLSPPVSDAEIVKTLAFPYNLGKTGFPAYAKPEDAVFNSIVALLMTGTNERLMHVDMGVNLHQYVWENMSPITQARISSAVARAIDDYEPRAQVLSVLPFETKGGGQDDVMLGLDIVYRKRGQDEHQQVLIPPTTQGM
jgi:phage baseplate assembly protein W